MIKNFLVVLIIFSGCTGGLKYLEVYDGYKGQPKKVEAITYRVSYENGMPRERLAYGFTDYFDAEGRKIKTLSFHSEGKVDSGGWVYFYDQNGNPTERILFSRDSTIELRTNLKYNRAGKEIERISVSGEKETITRTFYKPSDRTAQILGRTGGSFKENSIIKYDEQGKEVEVISYDSLGRLKTRIEFGYDGKGNKDLYKWFNRDNELYNLSKTRFNEYSDPVISRSYLISGVDTIPDKTTSYKYQYDEKKNIIEKKLYSNGELSWITRYNFDF